MDRGVLGALTVVKRVSALCCLVMTGCVLNPQGEDPGFEDSNGTTPNAGLPGLFPGDEESATDRGEPDGVVAMDPATIAPGATAAPAFPPVSGPVSDPTPGGGPTPSTSPEAPTEPASPVVAPPATPEPEPILEPSPDLGANGGAAASGSGGAGGGEVVEGPGIDFDGGTLNYASPTDADGPDGGTTLDEGDAGASSADAAAVSDAGEVSP